MLQHANFDDTDSFSKVLKIFTAKKIGLVIVKSSIGRDRENDIFNSVWAHAIVKSVEDESPLLDFTIFDSHGNELFWINYVLFEECLPYSILSDICQVDWVEGPVLNYEEDGMTNHIIDLLEV